MTTYYVRANGEQASQPSEDAGEAMYDLIAMELLTENVDAVLELVEVEDGEEAVFWSNQVGGNPD